eukprot:6203717-Pyramimonas_sp.AAC.1
MSTCFRTDSGSDDDEFDWFLSDNTPSSSVVNAASAEHVSTPHGGGPTHVDQSKAPVLLPRHSADRTEASDRRPECSADTPDSPLTPSPPTLSPLEQTVGTDMDRRPMSPKPPKGVGA